MSKEGLSRFALHHRLLRMTAEEIVALPPRTLSPSERVTARCDPAFVMAYKYPTDVQLLAGEFGHDGINRCCAPLIEWRPSTQDMLLHPQSVRELEQGKPITLPAAKKPDLAPELYAALESVVTLAKETCDRDEKVDTLLLALAGKLPGYLQCIDLIHDTIARATLQAKGAPPQSPEPSGRSSTPTLSESKDPAKS